MTGEYLSVSLILICAYSIYDCSVRLWKDPMRKMMDTNDAIGDASQVCCGWMLTLFALSMLYAITFLNLCGLQPSAVYTWKHAFW